MSSSRDPVRSTSGFLWLSGIAATVCLHGGIFGAVVLYRSRAEARPPTGPLMGQVIDVQAVKFGKPRDLSFLPHKQAVVLDKGPKPKIALTQNEQALPHLKDNEEKPPEEDDPLKRTRAHELQEMAAAEEQAGVEEEGDPNGVRGGTATVGRGPLFYQHLKAAVQNAWTVPTAIGDAELARLKARACFKISAEGKMIEVGIAAPSNNERFDATLLDALGRVKEAWSEVPTADVKDAVTGEGVCIDFRGNETR